MMRRRPPSAHYVDRATAMRILGCRNEADWQALARRGLTPAPTRTSKLGDLYKRREVLKAREVIFSRMPVAGTSHARH